MVGSERWKEGSKVIDGRDYGVCCTIPEGITAWQTAIIEFLGTVFLIITVCAHHDRRNALGKETFAIKVTIMIIADVICIVSKFQ